jgi:prepilin-type N-terminal cleavage/methylation domain-containing protein
VRMTTIMKKQAGVWGFTMVELMIVVVIVAILSAVSIPFFSANVKTGKMSEGIAGVGAVRSAFRQYSSIHNGRYPVLAGADGAGLTELGVTSTDLIGKYFTNSSYSVTSTESTYTIRCTLPEDNDFWYELDEGGNASSNSF